MLKFKAIAHMLKMSTGRSVKPPDTPEAIKKLLQPIESFDLETVSIPDENEVEDVFEEIHKKGYPNPSKSMNTTAKKIEANKIIAELFTEEHKKTMSALHKITEPEDDILKETIQDIMDVFEGPRVNYEPPRRVLEKIADILSDPAVIQPAPRQTDSREMSTISYDYMSGVWNMLEAQCKDKGFNVTPHNFDIYKQEEPHWLEKPDFSLETLNNSRTKCEQWLSKQDIK